MMIFFWLLGGFFLAFSFGRNTIGNVFGAAIGRGALSKKFCAVLMGLFILLGAYYGGDAVQSTLKPYLTFTTPVAVFIFSLTLAALILSLTYFGLPVSIAHLGIGGLAGWNFGFSASLILPDFLPFLGAWIFSPLMTAIFSFGLFYIVRWLLKNYPVPVFYKDLFVRINLVGIGCFIAFTLGQNNLSVLTAPFFQVFPWGKNLIVIGICMAILLGCLTASRRVIQTWSKGLFPLSCLEAMLTGFSVAMTMCLFSLKLPFIPAVPVSSAASLVGGIVGISLAKGGQGLQMKVLVRVAASWIWAPCLSGLLCFTISYILKEMGVF